MRLFRDFDEARTRTSTRPADRARLIDRLAHGSPADRIAIAIATTGLTGLLPRPGWWGGLAGALVACLSGAGPAGIAALAAWIAVASLAAHRACRACGLDDPPEVNADEVAGAWLACVLSGLSGWWLACPLVLFAALDALKPFPANAFESRGGTAGLMADDLVAGIYAGLLVRLALAAIPV